MSYSSEIKKVTGLGNGASNLFSFSPMVIYSSGQIECTFVDTDGTEAPIDTDDFTVEAAFDGRNPVTGSVRYPKVGSPLPVLTTGQKIVIKRKLALTQTQVKLQNQGGYDPAVQERAIDELNMKVLQVQEEVDRAFKVTIGSETDPDTLLTQILDAATEATAAAAAAAISETNAETAETNAEAAAAAAAISETNAETAETNAEAAATAAAISETNAETAETNAEAAAAAAAISETNAAASETAAAASALAAQTAETNAELAETNAEAAQVAAEAARDAALAAGKRSKVRNAVLSAASAFLSAGTGLSTTLLASSVPFVASASAGHDAGGDVDYIGRLTSDQAGYFSGLTANTTNFLYMDIASDGTITPGATPIPPRYEQRQQERFLLQFNNNATDDYNNSAWTETGTSLYTTSSPKFGSHCFNGATGRYITNTNFKTLSDDGWTIEFWVNPTSIAAAGCIFQSYNAGGYGFALRIETTGKLGHYLSTNGSSWNIANNGAGTATLSTGTWYHVACVWNGSTMRTFVNGTQDYSVAMTANATGGSGFRIGADATAAAVLNSKVDCFRVIPGALYGATFTAPSVALTPVGDVWDYDISRMKSYSGAGPTYTNRTRVYVGEAVTDASTVTSVRSYAKNRGFSSNTLSTYANGGLVTFAHNIGAEPDHIDLELVCLNTDAGYLPGDVLSLPYFNMVATNSYNANVYKDRNNVYLRVASSGFLPGSKSAGVASVALTAANWGVRAAQITKNL